jgi:hypothetical protein
MRQLRRDTAEEELRDVFDDFWNGCQIWKANFNLFSIKVISTPEAQWKASATLKDGTIKNYPLFRNRRIAYGHALIDMQHTMEYDLVVVENELKELE